MITMTATEVGRHLAKVWDLASHGTTIQVTRGNELVAVINPPVRPNGAAVLAAYMSHVPDPAFADDLEAVHADLNKPQEVRDPWNVV